MATAPPVKKSEETKERILETALAIFSERGFENATIRDIAAAAGVAVGAAYYHFESKDAIVTAFYDRAQQQMGPALDGILDRSRTLDARLRGIIGHKLAYFAPNRKLLGALTAHIDPQQPLSPFSEKTRPIRDQDIKRFARAVNDSKVKLPRTILPYLPRLLWMYQMGILLFWVYDESPEQVRTALLLDKTLRMILLGIRLGGLPILLPLHRLAGDLLKVLFENPQK